METMPAGEYYIGDLCYVIEDRWDDLLNTSKFKDGVFTMPDGTRFAIFSTMYGDGGYLDQFGRSYSVDSGTIGCVLLSDMTSHEFDRDYMERVGAVVNFTEPFKVGIESDGGSRGVFGSATKWDLLFGEVRIATGFDAEEEEDEEYYA